MPSQGNSGIPGSLVGFGLLQQIETFCRVADAGSFTAAARDLSLTQSAVSKHVKALEAALGVVLLERRHNGCRLTREGAVLFHYGRLLLETFRLLNETLAIQNGAGPQA